MIFLLIRDFREISSYQTLNREVLATMNSTTRQERVGEL